jgi:hypothetical protein
MVESGGGKYAKRNNVFGWKSGRAGFPSVGHAIDYVGSRLAHSPIYRGRNTSELLRIYNPARPTYGQKVRSVMEALAPEPAMVTAAAE